MIKKKNRCKENEEEINKVNEEENECKKMKKK